MKPKGAHQSGETSLAELVEQVASGKSTSALYQLKQTLERVHIKEKSIYERDEVVQSVARLKDLVSSKLLESLLNKAIEIDDAEMCAVIVKSVQILEETHMVECLKYFLKNSKDEKSDLESVEGKLDILFVKNYDYRILTGELKSLSSDEFVICLQYLRKHLKQNLLGSETDSSNSSDEMDTSTTPTAKAKPTTPAAKNNNRAELKPSADSLSSTPSLLQIVDLFGCFIDAHFTHITLLPVAQEIVLDSLQLIENQLDVFADIASIEALVKEMKRNKQFRGVKNNNEISYYFVEVLKL